ncbi:hypothetical protein FZ929_05945 [Klebsiella pneumoniae]|uniref:Acyl-CoA thioester hydrolase YciA n=1 Tax=Klebsiella pneumoniae TaxID=573 RepID=A0A5C2LI48_KLEPN|nr:hypothetical protein FZ929_05945 [Klebsiella pneumoniae]
MRYFHSSIPLIVFDHNRVEHDNNRSRPKGRNGLRTGNAGGYQCQRGYFWRLADVADGYWRRHYGQRDRPGRVVTVRVDGMTFLRPVAVGDVVCCYARCVKRGNTSVTINIEVWVKKFLQNRLASATRRRKRCLSTLPLIIRENHVLCQRNKKVPGLPGT